METMIDLSAFLASALATGLVFGLKTLFAVARKITQKTPTTLDDQIVGQTEEAFKDQTKNL